MLKLIIFLLTVHCLLSCSKKSETCSIKEVDGVKYYTNKNIPADSTVKLRLENERVITSCDEFQLRYPKDAAIDQSGNIYVLSYDDCRVLKFDKNMKYLKSFGQKGDGPGEFTQAENIVLLGKDTLAVYDNMIQKKLMFDLNGNFKESRPYKAMQLPIKILPIVNDKILALFVLVDQDNYYTGVDLSITDLNCIKLQTVTDFKLKKNDTKTRHYLRMPVYANGNNSFFVADYDENNYKIKEFDYNGKQLSLISKSYKKEQFNYKKEKRRSVFNSDYKRSISQLLYFNNYLLSFQATSDTEEHEDSLLSIDLFKNGMFLNNVKVKKPFLYDYTTICTSYKIDGNKLICFSFYDNTVYVYDLLIG